MGHLDGKSSSGGVFYDRGGGRGFEYLPEDGTLSSSDEVKL